MSPPVKSIFEEVRELAPAERDARLEAVCAGDESMLAEVRSLLAAFDASEGFLETPAVAGHPSVVLSAAQPAVARTIGKYRIIRQIGEGGMGVVYEAQRDDGEFSRRAAIKVIKPALASEFNLARFRRERQILANLTHPNIAQLFDAGTTDDGLPYFVMEYLEGRLIHDHCRECDLGMRERVSLFREVCAAVEYAHGRAIIHRDIKPRNILVTSGGAAKLLDFGIAKILSSSGAPAERTVTMTMHRMATPEYASPEQLRGDDVTPATDIYSLGVTLYEVLTGKCPYEVASRSPHEIAQQVCTNVPESPSALSSAISGELDRIVFKAMHKEPARRYASVGELSADLERYLEGAPVRARGDGAGYRLLRFLERQKQITATAAVLALLGGAWWLKTAAAPERRRSVAVVRIENLSQDPSLEWMDRGIAGLLTTNLAQSGALDVISTERVRAIMRRLRSDEQVPASQAPDVARAARADLFVSGALIPVGGRLRLDLRVQDSASGRLVMAEAFDGADAQSLFSMADQAATGIVAKLTSHAPAAAPHVAFVMTSNIEALRAYTEAERWIDHFRLPEARKLLVHATELDPRFVMAHYTLAIINAPWDLPAGRARLARAVDAAATQPLPRLQKLLIQAAQLQFDGRMEEAAAVLELLRREFPRETEPRLFLAGCRNEMFDFAGSMAPLQEILELDPNNANALIALAYSYAVQGDLAHSREYTERYCRLMDPGDWNGDDLLGDIMSETEHWEEAIAAYQRNVNKQPQGVLKPAFVATLMGDYDRAESFVRSFDPLFLNRFPGFKAIPEFILGNIEVARGRLDSAVEHFEKSARLYGNPRFRYDQLFKAAQIYFEIGEPRKVLEMAARHQTPWLPGLRGIAQQLLHNTSAAEAEFAELRTSLTPLIGDYMAVRTEWLDRLLAASYAGDHDRVIADWQKLPRSMWEIYALPVGRAYLEKGMLREAEQHLTFAYRSRLFFGGPGHYEGHNWIRYAMTQYYLGRLAELAGRRDEARTWYNTFLRHFHGSEERLPQIAAARAAAARL